MPKTLEHETMPGQEHGNGHTVDVVLRNLPQVERPMTFADMLQEQRRWLHNPKAWEWCFPKVCHRKDQASMTDTERSRFLCAFELINANGTLGQLVDIHAQNHMQHMSDRLLPWHRVFLHLFEEAMHHFHPDVCIPYWDWTRPEEQKIPDWLATVLPVVHTPTRTITVTRAPGAASWLAGIAAGVPSAMAETNYLAFANPINGIHGGVHVWVGGSMSWVSTSPADPLFWLHHGNLDRLWWNWYNSAAGGHQNPALVGSAAVMDPWTYLESDTRDIHTLGYSYV